MIPASAISQRPTLPAALPSFSSHVNLGKLGKRLGSGHFFSVYSVNVAQAYPSKYIDDDISGHSGVTISTVNSDNTDCSSKDECSCPKSARCALKRCRTSMDSSERLLSVHCLWYEAKILKSLPEHDNIIKLVTTSKNLLRLNTNNKSVSDDENDDDEQEEQELAQEDTKEPCFLVFEQLDDTLQDRLRLWSLNQSLRKKDIPCSSMRLPFSWFNYCRIKRDKEQGKSLVLQDQINRLRSCALGIAKAMRHIHHHGVVHGDLKPANVGFSWDNTVRLFTLDWLDASSPVNPKILVTRSPKEANPKKAINQTRKR